MSPEDEDQDGAGTWTVRAIKGIEAGKTYTVVAVILATKAVDSKYAITVARRPINGNGPKKRSPPKKPRRTDTQTKG